MRPEIEPVVCAAAADAATSSETAMRARSMRDSGRSPDVVRPVKRPVCACERLLDDRYRRAPAARVDSEGPPV